MDPRPVDDERPSAGAPQGKTVAAQGAKSDGPGNRTIAEDLRPPHPDHHLSALSRARSFFGRVFSKADEDNIFFMAGAITFNVLVAIVPLLLLVVGVAGIVLSARVGDPAGYIITLFFGSLPSTAGAELEQGFRRILDPLLEERANLTVLGALVFVWISTRLVGTLRTALREIFDIAQDRGIVRGKIYDAKIVVITGFLAVVNLGITFVLQAVRDYGVTLLGLQGSTLRLTQSLFGSMVALVSIWVMFFLIYRYLPARRIPWRTSLIAATFTGAFFEIMKLGFSWYVTSVANYRTAYGNLATAAIFFFWIYYVAVVFILGGEIAQVYTMRRARRLRTRKAIEGQSVALGLALAVGAVGALVPGSLLAQDFSEDNGVLYRARSTEREVTLDAPLIEYDGQYILVHLAENRVFLLEGNRTLWSAPAGTGTGFRLAGQGRRWKFTTPRGLFKVRRKEKDPIWEAPDWYYVEKGLRIPAVDHPSRRIPGVMGTTALYLGDGLAIHGTNSPGLLLNPDPERRRVSHGCIRLTNEAARDLYHRVEVGTPVLIY